MHIVLKRLQYIVCKKILITKDPIIYLIHSITQVTVNKGHFTGVIYVEVFQVDKNKEKIVTRTNTEGWKMGAETISLCCGEHYIILPGCDGEIQSVVSGNRWTSKNGNIYEPHGCLKKGKQ